MSVLFQFQGGLKAAITADVVQGLSMIACSLAIIIFGSIDVGGFGKVVDLSSERGRLHFFKYGLTVTYLHTLRTLWHILSNFLQLLPFNLSLSLLYCPNSLHVKAGGRTWWIDAREAQCLYHYFSSSFLVLLSNLSVSILYGKSFLNP